MMSSELRSSLKLYRQIRTKPTTHHSLERDDHRAPFSETSEITNNKRIGYSLMSNILSEDVGEDVAEEGMSRAGIGGTGACSRAVPTVRRQCMGPPIRIDHLDRTHIWR